MMIKHVHILLWQYFIWKYARYPFSFLFKWSIDLWVAVRLSFGRCIIHILWWMILWSLPFSHSRSSVIIKPQFEKFISLYNMANIFHLYICVCVCACVWSENEKEWEWWRKQEKESCWVKLNSCNRSSSCFIHHSVRSSFKPLSGSHKQTLSHLKTASHPSSL